MTNSAFPLTAAWVDDYKLPKYYFRFDVQNTSSPNIPLRNNNYGNKTVVISRLLSQPSVRYVEYFFYISYDSYVMRYDY